MTELNRDLIFLQLNIIENNCDNIFCNEYTRDEKQNILKAVNKLREVI